MFPEVVDQDRRALLQVPAAQTVVVGDRVLEVERVVDSPSDAVPGFEVGFIVGTSGAPY
jgi:hypothetical protein